MEGVVARLRLGAVLLAGAEILRSSVSMSEHGIMVVLWSIALIYAAGALLFEPYRRASLITWTVVTGVIDWGFITLGHTGCRAARQPCVPPVLLVGPLCRNALRYPRGAGGQPWYGGRLHCPHCSHHRHLESIDPRSGWANGLPATLRTGGRRVGARAGAPVPRPHQRGSATPSGAGNDRDGESRPEEPALPLSAAWSIYCWTLPQTTCPSTSARCCIGLMPIPGR